METEYPLADLPIKHVFGVFHFREAGLSNYTKREGDSPASGGLVPSRKRITKKTPPADRQQDGGRARREGDN